MVRSRRPHEQTYALSLRSLRRYLALERLEDRSLLATGDLYGLGLAPCELLSLPVRVGALQGGTPLAEGEFVAPMAGFHSPGRGAGASVAEGTIFLATMRVAGDGAAGLHDVRGQNTPSSDEVDKITPWTPSSPPAGEGPIENISPPPRPPSQEPPKPPVLPPQFVRTPIPAPSGVGDQRPPVSDPPSTPPIPPGVGGQQPPIADPPTNPPWTSPPSLSQGPPPTLPPPTSSVPPRSFSDADPDLSPMPSVQPPLSLAGENRTPTVSREIHLTEPGKGEAELQARETAIRWDRLNQLVWNAPDTSDKMFVRIAFGDNQVAEHYAEVNSSGPSPLTSDRHGYLSTSHEPHQPEPTRQPGTPKNDSPQGLPETSLPRSWDHLSHLADSAPSAGANVSPALADEAKWATAPRNRPAHQVISRSTPTRLVGDRADELILPSPEEQVAGRSHSPSAANAATNANQLAAAAIPLWVEQASWEDFASGAGAALGLSTGSRGGSSGTGQILEESRDNWGLLFAPALFAFGVPKRYQATILLVEHDEPTRDALHVLLAEEGYLVLAAGTAHDAWGVLRAPLAPIDLILLDAHLPDVSGMMLYARLQELYPDLPVVVCCRGELDPSELAEFRILGAPFYLRKPVAEEKLLATVQAVLS